MVLYPETNNLLRSDLEIALPRAPRIYAPGGTVHIVARCNNREFYFQTAADFNILLEHLCEMSRSYEVPIFAYTLMSNHIHLLAQTPAVNALGRPLRWFMTQTAKTFHRLRGRRGHFWERRYRACLVEDDLYALAALRYLDRNPVRAGLVEDPAAYEWSSCASYARGEPNRLLTYHPSYLGLSRYAKVRQRHYRTLVSRTAETGLETREPHWTTQRAVGSAEFLSRHLPPGARRRNVLLPVEIRNLRS